jgi:DNA invertase Pin-like site-specific DNA recombinase
VSGKAQEDNESNEVQREGIIKYCKLHNLGTPFFVYEVASAARPMFDFKLRGESRETSKETGVTPRPLLFALMLALQSLPVRDSQKPHLIFWKMDRLSRHSMDQELLLRRCWEHGIAVHSTQDTEHEMLDVGAATNDPQRDFFRHIMVAAAALERSMIVMRTAVGKAHKAQKGGYCGGRPPFGYRAEGSELAIDPTDAMVTRYIFDKRDSSGWSLETIAQHLASMDPDGHWSRTKIRRIIQRRRFYNGWQTDTFGRDHHKEHLRVLGELPACLATQNPLIERLISPSCPAPAATSSPGHSP